MSQETSWNPTTYAKNARFVADLGEPLLDLLAAKSNDRVLDLGCGDGALTEKLVALGCKVFGCDSSLAQLRAAQSRRLETFLMDGQQLGLKRCFDAVLTNAALHWMKDAASVINGVAACLKPGGRFIGEFGGQGNVEMIRSALHSSLRQRGIDPWSVDPWYYPSPEEYTKLLKDRGFAVEYIELIPRPTKLPGDILGWLEVFGQPFSKAVAEQEGVEYLSEVRDQLKPLLLKADGNWYADYKRLRFKARLTTP